MHGNSRMYGNSIMYDSSGMYENSSMYGNSIMYENSRMYDSSSMYENSSMRGNSSMHGNSIMYENSRMYDSSSMYENSSMYGNSIMRGSQILRGTQSLHCEILTIKRSDGYDFAYWPDADGVWMVTAGCMYVSMPDAREHWYITRRGTALGDETMMILDWLEQWQASFGRKLWDERPTFKGQGE